MKINKVVMMFVLGLLLLVGTVSAELTTFDNVKRYDAETQTVTVKNLFGLGKTYAEVQLKTPLVYEVGLGYQKVAEFEIRGLADYSGIIKGMDFYNVKNMEETEIIFNYKKKIIYEVEVDDYDVNCINSKDLENIVPICSSTKIGSHIEERISWEDITPENIRAGEILTIGMFTTTYEGQNVEWIPNLFGVKVDEWASWTADLNTDLHIYYPLNESSGVDVDNVVGGTDGLNYGADVNQAGHIGTSYNFVRTSEDIGEWIYVNDTRLDINRWTVNMWVNPDVFGSGTNEENYIFVVDSSVGGTIGWNMNSNSCTNSSSCVLATYNPSTLAFGTVEWITGEWQMLTINMDNVANWVAVYKNGVLIANLSGSDTSGDGTLPILAARDNSKTLNARSFDGQIDEFGLWNRSLTSTEVTLLYNSGSGMTYLPITPPTSTLNSPANAVTVYNPNVIFNATGTDNSILQNMSLYVNGSLKVTNSSPINNTLTGFAYTLPSVGFYNWTVEACDDENTCTNATYRNITYADSLAITLNAPPIMENFTISTFGLNGTGVDDTSLANISLILNATYNGTTNSPANNTLINFDRTLADGFYNWTMEVCDVYTCTNATTWNFTIDTTNPAVNITDPFPNNTQISFHDSSTNQTFNWTATDIRIDTCWINYNDTNRTVTCNVNTSSFALSDDRFAEFWSNDTFGNYNSLTRYWDYTFFQTGSSFNAKAYETNDETFSINLSIPSGVTDVSSFLSYNGTSYAATSSCVGSACYIDSTIDIPLMDTTAAYENNSFNWVVTTFDGSTTSTLTTDSDIQNVSLINFTKCGSPHSAVIFNITNESDRVSLVADFDATFKYYIGSGTVVKIEESTQSAATNYDYCISPNETYIVSSTIFLSATGFESRNFDFNLETYDNLSQVIRPLRLANSTYQTVSSIIIEVSDAGLAPMQGVLVNISRYFPSTNSYLLVESQITDEFGQFVAKLIEDDVKYKFAFYDSDGVLLQTSDKITIACRASICVIPFVMESTLDDMDRFETPSLYSSTLSFDNTTNIVSFFWDDQTGDSITTTLNVVRYRFNESTTVCSNTSTSSLSTLFCGVGDSTASYKVQVDRNDGADDFRIAVLDFKVGTNFSIYGMEGLLWVFILLFTCIGIGAFNPSVGIGLYGVAFMMMGIIGIISMPLSVFFANTILCVLFIWGVNK